MPCSNAQAFLDRTICVWKTCISLPRRESTHIWVRVGLRGKFSSILSKPFSRPFSGITEFSISKWRYNNKVVRSKSLSQNVPFLGSYFQWHNWAFLGSGNISHSLFSAFRNFKIAWWKVLCENTAWSHAITSQYLR